MKSRFALTTGSVDVGRRCFVRVLGAFSLLLVLPGASFAQEHSGGESGAHGEGEAGAGAGHGNGAGEGHGGGHGEGEGGGGGHGEGEAGGGGMGQGKTPAQRAVRHRQRTGRTMGGGESNGGHTGTGDAGAGETTTSTGSTALPSDGATTGPIGGDTGGEHFVHQGQGPWGADTKVLRRK